MKTKKFEAGETVEIQCASCELEQVHTVETVTKQGKITKTTCQVCGTGNTYSKGVKTSTAMSKTKSSAPYDRTNKYRKGQGMLHSMFGPGEVTAVIEPQKIDVLFGDRTRRLIHAQN